MTEKQQVEAIVIGAKNRGGDLTESDQIDIQVKTAKAYPRALAEIQQQVEAFALRDEDTAATMYYRLPRADKTITGPSVRLAELVRTCWGNIISAVRVRDDKTTNRYVYAEAMVWDTQANVRHIVEAPRRITDSKNRIFNEDMIQTTKAAAMAIALRNATFQVIPRMFFIPVYEAAMKMVAGDKKTLANRRALALEYGLKQGIDEPRVLQALGVSAVEEIDGDKLATLRGMFTALKEGQNDIDDLFPEPQAVKAAQAGGKRVEAAPIPDEPPGDEDAQPSEPEAPEPARPTSNLFS